MQLCTPICDTGRCCRGLALTEFHYWVYGFSIHARIGAPVSHAFDLYNFHPRVSLAPFFHSRLSPIAPSSTTGEGMNHTLSRLHSPPPPALPPFPFCLLLF